LLTDIKANSANSQQLLPKEIAGLYSELRSLTEEVKTYFAYHAILTVMDSVLIFVSCVTVLTLNYTSKLESTLFYNELIFIYCIFKLLFLYLIVRETHNTVQEVSVSILHKNILFPLHYKYI